MAAAATIRGVRLVSFEEGMDPHSGFDRATRRRCSAAAHSPKFHAVIEPTTAANWWLLRVAWRLRRLNAVKRRSRIGLSRQPATVSAGPTVEPLVLNAFFRAPLERRSPFPLLRPVELAFPSTGAVGIGGRAPKRPIPIDQIIGTRKLSAPSAMVTRWSCNGRFCNPACSMNRRIGISSAMCAENTGLLMVPASWIG